MLLQLACSKSAPSNPVAIAVSASATSSTRATSTSNRAPVAPASAVQAVLNPEGLPAYTGAVGSLEGTIYVEGPAAPDLQLDFSGCPQAKAMHGFQFRAQPAASDASKRVLADAVVGITGYVGYVVPETRPAVQLTAKDCMLSARTAVLTFGQQLDVKNIDVGETHTYYAFELSGSPTAALRVATSGSDAIPLYPQHPGNDRLVEKMGRGFMTADVIVVPTPLHAVSDALGHYRIDGIPIGKLDAHAMHPSVRMRGVDAPVEILAGTATNLDMTIRFEGAAAPGVTVSAKPAAGAKAPATPTATKLHP
jgi:hypothetical protein